MYGSSPLPDQISLQSRQLFCTFQNSSTLRSGCGMSGWCRTWTKIVRNSIFPEKIFSGILFRRQFREQKRRLRPIALERARSGNSNLKKSLEWKLKKHNKFRKNNNQKIKFKDSKNYETILEQGFKKQKKFTIKILTQQNLDQKILTKTKTNCVSTVRFQKPISIDRDVLISILIGLNCRNPQLR